MKRLGIILYSIFFLPFVFIIAFIHILFTIDKTGIFDNEEEAAKAGFEFGSELMGKNQNYYAAIVLVIYSLLIYKFL